jgi:isopentenyl diphosphate isomerase/L-lactate dehydrogenase-like FMN-dependent dehydrogenase
VDLASNAGRESASRARSIPTRVDLKTAFRYAPEMVPHPGWVFHFLRGGRRLEVPNVRLVKDGAPLSVAEASASMQVTAPTWEDLAWIRRQWTGSS